MDGVWIAPVTAQVMMTLFDFATAGISWTYLVNQLCGVARFPVNG